MNEADLIARLISKGYVRDPNGIWEKPARVRAVEANSPEQAPLRPLDGRQAKQRRSDTCMVVHLIACRRKLLDPDAVAFALKPLTDCIARSLAIDDADPRIKWEWSQVKTQGREGVIVRIEEV